MGRAFELRGRDAFSPSGSGASIAPGPAANASQPTTRQTIAGFLKAGIQRSRRDRRAARREA